MFRHRGSVSPIPQSGLSLWLKADAGVSKLSFNYVSQIVLSGGYSTGTYTATTAPTWDTANNTIAPYSLGDINYYNGNFTLTVAQTNYFNATIISNDGITWEPEIEYYVPPTISGVTGQYAGANGGNYNYNDAPTIIDYFKDATNYLTFYISGDFNNYYLSAYNSDTNTNYPNLATCTNGTWVGNVSETTNISGFITRVPDPNNMPTGSITTSTVNTDYVTEWADQSGNERDFVPWYSNASTSLFSGKTFLNFDSDTALYNTSNVIWPDTGSVDYGTIITVARFPFSQPSGSQPSYIFSHGGILYIARGSDLTYPDGITGTKDNDSNTWGNSNLSNNTNYLIGMTFNLDSLTLYLNGTVNGSGSGFENSSPNEMSIGYSPSQPFSIAEIVVYNRVLTTQERQQVEAYLNSKYAIY